MSGLLLLVGKQNSSMSLNVEEQLLSDLKEHLRSESKKRNISSSKVFDEMLRCMVMQAAKADCL